MRTSRKVRLSIVTMVLAFVPAFIAPMTAEASTGTQAAVRAGGFCSSGDDCIPLSGWSDISWGYYWNYFKSHNTCKARGRSMLWGPSGVAVPGMRGYFCYWTAGKWSMDVYWK